MLSRYHVSATDGLPVSAPGPGIWCEGDYRGRVSEGVDARHRVETKNHQVQLSTLKFQERNSHPVLGADKEFIDTLLCDDMQCNAKKHFLFLSS